MEKTLTIQKSIQAAQRENQDRIMFQNQSHLVENYFSHQGIKPELYDICLATDLMVEYVKYGSTSKDVRRRFEGFQEYIEKKYNLK